MIEYTGRIDKVLAEQPWPVLAIFDRQMISPGDTIIVCAGFEDRVLGVLNLLNQSSIQDLTIICIEYSPVITQNKGKIIQQLCVKRGWKYQTLTYDRCNPQGIFSLLKTLLNYIGQVFIDISGMSRLLIVQLVVGFLENENKSATVLYSEATTYPPTEAEIKKEFHTTGIDTETALSFISAGVYDVAVVPELSSMGLNINPIRLIAFPSFNPSQLIGVRSIIQPGHITLIHGVPPIGTLAWRERAICEINHVDEAIGAEIVRASTLNYEETGKIILDLYGRWSSFNSLVVSPTGSKMQSVAVGIVKAFISDLQIVYPIPLRFTSPEAHTSGIGLIYALSLNDFSQLKKRILESS